MPFYIAYADPYNDSYRPWVADLSRDFDNFDDALNTAVEEGENEVAEQGGPEHVEPRTIVQIEWPKREGWKRWLPC